MLAVTNFWVLMPWAKCIHVNVHKLIRAPCHKYPLAWRRRAPTIPRTATDCWQNCRSSLGEAEGVEDGASRVAVLAGASKVGLEAQEATWLRLALRLEEVHPPLALHPAEQEQLHCQQGAYTTHLVELFVGQIALQYVNVGPAHRHTWTQHGGS